MKTIRFSSNMGILPIFWAFYCFEGWIFSLRSIPNRSKSKKPAINHYFLALFSLHQEKYQINIIALLLSNYDVLLSEKTLFCFFL